MKRLRCQTPVVRACGEGSGLPGRSIKLVGTGVRGLLEAGF